MISPALYQVMLLRGQDVEDVPAVRLGVAEVVLRDHVVGAGPGDRHQPGIGADGDEPRRSRSAFSAATIAVSAAEIAAASTVVGRGGGRRAGEATAAEDGDEGERREASTAERGDMRDHAQRSRTSRSRRYG